MTHITYSSGNLFANTSLTEPVLKSTNNGDSWNKINQFQGTTYNNLQIIPEKNFLFGFFKNELFRSSDNGQTWTDVTNGITFNPYTSPAITSEGSNFWAISIKGVFKSTNNGTSWTEVNWNTGLPNYTYLNNGIGTNGYLVAVANNKGIFRSPTTGTFSFTKVFDLTNGERITDVVKMNGKIYMASSKDALLISSDDGATFSRKNTGVSFNDLHVHDGVLYGGASPGFYKIENDGNNLTQLLDNGLESLQVTSIAAEGSVFFLGTNSGVCRSTNLKDWGMANKGFGFLNIWGFAVGPTDTYYMATSGGVWRSKTYGQRWIPVGLKASNIRSIIYANNRVYALEENGSANTFTIFSSTDEGQNWSQTGNVISNVVRPLLATIGGHLFCQAQQGSASGIYKLTNFSGNWTKVSVSGGVAFNAIGNKLYSGTKVGDQNGGNWSNLSGNISNVSPYVFTQSADGSTIYAGAFKMVNGRPYAFKSTNGTNFSTFQSGMNNQTQTVFGMIQRGDTIYAAAQTSFENTQTYLLEPGATSWKKFGGNLLDNKGVGDRTTLVLTPKSLLMGTNSGLGVFRADFEDLPDVPDDVDVIDYPPLDPAILLSANPQVSDLPIGGNKQITLTVDATGDYTGTVNLALEGGLPVGLSADFSTTTIATEGDATVTFTAGASLAPGQYTVKIKASSGSLSDDATIVLNVAGATSPDFTLALNPNSVSVNQGATGKSTLSYDALAGFNKNVSLSIKTSSLPTGVTVDFASTTLSAGGSVELTVKADVDALVGKHNIVIVGTSGSITREVTLQVTVVEVTGPDFALVLDPASLSIDQKSSGETTVSYTGLAGFTDDVTISVDASTIPNGVTAIFESTTITNGGSSKLSLEAAQDAITGQHTIKVIGASGVLTNEVDLIVTINEVKDPDFNLTLNPNRLSINRGESGISNVVVESINGFSADVSLSLINNNPDVTAVFSTNSIDSAGISEITLDIAAEAAVGETKITVTGTHDTLIHSDTLYLQITVPVIANNQFSPNGDLQDETWFIENIDLMPEYEVIVFNRVGQEVFRSKAYQNDWNGMSNGKTLLPTTYFYVIRNEKGKNVESGSVNLIR